MAEHRPLVVVLGGPNGAGKSTVARELLDGAYAVHEFVNADTIAGGLSGFRPDSVAIEAGRVMLRRLRELAASRADFAFETTLAARSYAPWLRELRRTGYRVHVTFVSLPDPALAAERVAARVRAGGHDIPRDVIDRRFAAGLHNLFALYLPLASGWRIYDNQAATPRLIARRDQDAEPLVLDGPTLALLERYR